MELYEKRDKLEAYIKGKGKLAVAFSYGVDSTYLLKTAHDILGDDVIAIIAKHAAFPETEYMGAKNFCEKEGIEAIIIEHDMLSIPEVLSNQPDRCYHCKTALMTSFLEKAYELGIDAVADGTNADDDAGDRPGMRALEELGIISPLKEAGLTKADIRELSKELGLPTWDKPSMACLATRIPTGIELSAETMIRIDAAEQYIRSLGFSQVRVRAQSGTARIEIYPSEFGRMLQEDIAEKVSAELLRLGFSHVTLDLKGYGDGSKQKRS
jgi:uncharacterized protein